MRKWCEFAEQALLRSMVLLLFAVLLFAASPRKTSADTAVKTLKKNTTYNLKLNGTVKKVKYTVTFSNYVGTFHLYVNGKKVYSKKLSATGESTGVDSVKLIDVNTSDKYKELLIDVSGDESDSWVFLVRYYSDSRIVSYPLALSDVRSPRITSYGITNTGKNQFTLMADTPYWNRHFGCYFAMVPFKLQGGKIKQISTKKFRLNIACVSVSIKSQLGGWYVLGKARVLYKTASLKKRIRTLGSGTKLTPRYIYVRGTSKDSWGSTQTTLSVYVKTSTGATGWIAVPVSGTSVFRKTMAWG